MAQIPGTPDYDESKNRLEIFCKYFVELYELKLDAYTMFIEGKLSKTGKFADFFSQKIGQGAGGLLAFLIAPLPIAAGAKLGDSIVGPLGKKIGKKFHGGKVNRVFHLLECWRNDKPGFREKLVEGALDLGYCFEMQLMFIKVELGGCREALRLVALDSVNRSFNFYEKIERSIEQVTVSESVLRGNSKIETVLGMPIDVKYIKTAGFTIYYRNENNEWRTSSLFEKSGVVIYTDNSTIYYKLKINSRTSKYGYRRLLKCEIGKWSKLCENYEKEPDLSETAQFTDYNYKFSQDSDKFAEIKKSLLDHVNEEDPKLQEERMNELLTEIKESILHEIQTLIDANEIYHNLLVNMDQFLTEFIVDILQLQRNFLDVTNKNQQETVSCFTLASEERQELADANTSQHKETQVMVARVEEKIDQLKNPGSKASLPIKYKVRDCNLNYVKRYNANGLCKIDEINAHFYPNNVSSNDSNDSKSPIPIVIISGLGGVGKSEEVRNYCKFWWDKHEGIDRAVLWIDCSTIISFIDTFKSVGFKLGIWTKNDDVPKSEKEIVEAIYSYFLDRETLFVFDDADEHVQKFLPQSVSLTLYENQKLPYVLMTSRTKLWDGAHEGFARFQLVELVVFTKQEGLNYVKGCFDKFQREIPNDNDILDLCKLLNYLPLALRQALAYVQAEKGSVGQYAITDYIAEYNVNEKKLLSFGPYKNDEERYSNPVLTTWLFTLKKIRNQPGGKEARDILNILAYLKQNATELHKILGISVTESSDVKVRDLKAGIQLLCKYSMIDVDSDERVYVHALVQKVMRIQLRKVSIVWHVALALFFVSLLFIIINAKFSFGPELCWFSLAIGFISFLYVASNSYNTETPTIAKVLHLLSSEEVSRDSDTVYHASVTWCYATNYFMLVFKHYFVIRNLDNRKWSIQRYGPMSDTPLHILSCAHTVSVYKLLWYISLLAKLPKLKESIVNAKNSTDLTPLHMACFHQKPEIITLLTKNGADVMAKDRHGCSVLMLAVIGAISNKSKENHTDSLEKVLDHILTTDRHKTLFNERLQFYTPLRFALVKNDYSTAKLLVDRGANVNAHYRDSENLSYLHDAIHLDKVDMAELLIKNGANIETKDVDGCTPLHYAVCLGKVDMVDLLIKHDANVEAKNVDGRTPLHYAVNLDTIDMTKFLLEQGAEIEAVDVNENTLLHYVALSDKVDMAELLIKQGANIKAENLDRNTPLHYAFHMNEVGMAEFLIKHGANIEVEDVEGTTPLHVAVEKSSSNMSKMLCNYRTHGNAKNCDEDSPLHIAGSHNNLDTLLKSENTNFIDSCRRAIFLSISILLDHHKKRKRDL